jgi:hypothetical protein
MFREATLVLAIGACDCIVGAAWTGSALAGLGVPTLTGAADAAWAGADTGVLARESVVRTGRVDGGAAGVAARASCAGSAAVLAGVSAAATILRGDSSADATEDSPGVLLAAGVPWGWR